MKHHPRFAIALALGALAATAFSVTPASAADAVYTIDSSHSEVAFRVRHLLTKVRGSFNAFEGTIEMSDDPAACSVEFTIEAASIDTANEQRDAHLRSPDFFDTETHGSITFTSTRVTKTGEGAYDVTGILDMHGVEKEITLPVTFLGEMSFRGAIRAGFEASTVIARKDWGIVWNAALDKGGTVLGEQVTVEINLEVIKQQEEMEAAE